VNLDAVDAYNTI